MQHADAEASDDIDDRDEDAGDGVAADEFAGTVHGAVEVGFFLDLEAAGGGGEFIDDAGVEFGIDGHLFAGHGVEGEPGGNFGDAACAFGDDDEIDDDENDENDGADEVVALN